LPAVEIQQAPVIADPEPDPIIGPEAPLVPAPPLDDLLRLPESITRSHVDAGAREADPEALTDEEREAARLRVEIRRQQESVEFDPNGSRVRERTDAGVSVDVGGDTRVKSGVRVEKEPDEEWRDPVPTVGVEKRF
jgi:hypothetical protein